MVRRPPIDPKRSPGLGRSQPIAPSRRRCSPGPGGLTLLVVVLLSFVTSSPSSGQPTLELVDEIDFDDPQAWAMKYFTSAALPTSLGLDPDPKPWAVDLGLELIHVPHLDRQQRTVGFGGFKEEDLNRSPLWGRLRLGVGLPGSFRLVAGWSPPIELDGIEASLLSLALERRLWATVDWDLMGRVYVLKGEARGDLTCSEGGDHLAPPGSEENPFGCEAPSADTLRMEARGAELVVSRRWLGGLAVYLGVAGNDLDLEFQVDALTFGFRDRTLLLTDGRTVSATIGATKAWASERWSVSGELFYSPLDVQRPGKDGSSNDPLWHLRALLRYRL